MQAAQLIVVEPGLESLGSDVVTKAEGFEKSWSTMLAPVLTIASTIRNRIMSTKIRRKPALISDPARHKIIPHSGSPSIRS
jgi:hypothetical protein